MPTTVKTGWLHDKNGDKFAPKTLISQVQTSDGILLEDKIQADLDAVKEDILENVSIPSHAHDDRYYTETEIDTKLSGKANASDLTSHTGNTTVHITTTERTNWNAAKTHADSAHAPSDAEKNQNAFGNILDNGNAYEPYRATTATDAIDFHNGNGTVVNVGNGTSGVQVKIDVANGSIYQKGIVQLTDSTSSTSTTTAATPNSVKSAYDLANAANTAAAAAQETADALETVVSGKANSSHVHPEYLTRIDPVVEGSFSMNRKIDTTIAPYSFAEGYLCTASGTWSHAEGNETYAEADAAHSEGNYTHASAACAHAEGYQTSAVGFAAHSEGVNTTAHDYQHASGKYNAVGTAPASPETQDSTHADAIFMIGCGTSSATKNAFRVASSGKCYGTMPFSTSGADFAELFEWADGNPNNEDRRGLFVALDGDKIRLANAGEDYIGIISGNEAFVGNTASEEWQGKYLSDVFGTKLSQTIEIPAEIDEKTGKVIKEACTTTQFVLNPDYDPNAEYVMRENRKEWGTVGLLGQVVAVDDGTCVAGGYVEPSVNGIGTASNTGYRVMKRIDENHIKVLVK